MNVKSTVVAAILACSIGLVSLPLQASVMFFDDFDDGDVATNPGIGSGFQVSPRSIGAPGTTTLVESSGTLTIDNPGAPGNLQGGVATIDTFVYATAPGHSTRVTWSVDSATTIPGHRHYFTLGDNTNRLELNFWGTFYSGHPDDQYSNEIILLLNGSGGLVHAFTALHNIDWDQSFDVVLEVGIDGYSIDWQFGSTSGSWPANFDYAAFVASEPGGHSVGAIASEGPPGNTDLVGATLVLDSIGVENLVPEPSSAVILALAMLVGILRRVRGFDL